MVRGFSIVGAMYMIPLVWSRSSPEAVTEAICRPAANDNTMTNDPRMFYLLYLFQSVGFRRYDLCGSSQEKTHCAVHYHHFLTQLFTVYAITTVRFNSSAAYFCAMNFGVHAIMYSWYAAIRHRGALQNGSLFVTFLQLIQMVGGCWIVLSLAMDHVTRVVGVSST